MKLHMALDMSLCVCVLYQVTLVTILYTACADALRVAARVVIDIMT